METQLLKLKLEREQKASPNLRHDRRPGSGKRKEEVDSASAAGDEESPMSEGELVQKHFAARVADLSAQVSAHTRPISPCCVHLVRVCMCPSVRLSVHPSVHVCVCVYVCVRVYPSIRSSIRVCVYVHVLCMCCTIPCSGAAE